MRQPQTMWAYRLNGPLTFVRDEIEVPSAGDLAHGDVLLRFLAGGICGSDIARCRAGIGFTGREPFGLSLHEIVGEVVASHSELKMGKRVVGWVNDAHGLCEYVVTSAADVRPVIGEIKSTEAVAIQPLACVLHALSWIPDIKGANAAVIGLGPIGLLFAHALKDAGASSVQGVDLIDRQDLAEIYGLDGVVHGSSRAWASVDEARGSFEIVIEAVGHQVGTLNDAVDLAAHGGRIICFGNPSDAVYPVHFAALMKKNLTLHAGRTPLDKRHEALRCAQEYLARNPELTAAYITHILPVKEVNTAFTMAARSVANQIKIVLVA